MHRILALLLLTGCAAAADDCGAGRYNPPKIISIERPVSLVVVDEMPQHDGCTGQWGCAVNADGQGRAIIYVRSDKLACIYHEMSHVAGWKHEGKAG